MAGGILLHIHDLRSLRSTPFLSVREPSVFSSRTAWLGLFSAILIFKQQIKAVAHLAKVLQLPLFCSHIAFVATTAILRHLPSVFLLFWNKKHTNTSFFRFGT